MSSTSSPRDFSTFEYPQQIQLQKTCQRKHFFFPASFVFPIMSRFSIVILSLMLFLAQATATGNCRDGVCSNSPSKIGDSCQCWSTCNSVDDARKCDGASSLWSGYQRANQGGNDVGCTYIPFASISATCACGTTQATPRTMRRSRHCNSAAMSRMARQRPLAFRPNVRMSSTQYAIQCAKYSFFVSEILGGHHF